MAEETERATPTGTANGATARDTESPHADSADPPLVRYSVDLFHAFGAVCDKAKSGVQSCQAVAAFVAERANMEAAYARALTKTATHARADDWAPGFAKCWTLVHEMLAALGKMHTDSAAKMQSSMVAGARAFAAQQEIQVQRLIAEGTKFRTAQQNIVHSMERAKEKYDKRCAEAQEILASMHVDSPSTPVATTNNITAHAVASPTSNLNGGLEESKEIVGQLLTRMSSFTKPSLERQRSRLEGCLEELLAAERQYTQTVEHFNSKQVILEREIAENLLAFQLTEEQRIEYLKDLLERLQKLLLRNLETAAEMVGKLRDSTADINEFVDIEDGFRKLSQTIDSSSQLLDPSDNTFYQRMCQVQAMSDRGHTVLRNFHSTLADLMSIEDHFVSSAQRLLRAHEAPPSSTGDLFNLSPALSQVIDEGSTMNSGWQATKDQLQRLWQIHLEFRSLLAEPVALNIETMKQDYENARSTTHENFSKSHMALCQDSAMHQKLKHKLDTKCRDFAQLFASLPGMGEIDLRNLDVTQVLVLVQQLSSSFSEKEKRTEAKLRVLGEDVREAQLKFSDSTTVLKTRSAQYIQDVDTYISAYMKNEKFRLQVEKSSLVSLTKALEHKIEGSKQCVKAAIAVVDLVEPTKDMAEFVGAHRKPRAKKSKRVTPEYVCDESLKEAIAEYCRNKADSLQVDEEKKVMRNGDTKTSPKYTKSTSSMQKSEITASTSEQSRRSAMTFLEDERDGQLLGTSDFQRQFKLESPEQVVESYSCALYANNFPNHGRMYLTSDHVCFSGWRDTTYVVSYVDITNLEKKNSALIVPNALEITAKGEKVFFTSFVFRDECLQHILQLQAIKKATAAALADHAKPSISTEDSPPSRNAPMDAPSPTSQAPVVPSPTPAFNVNDAQVVDASSNANICSTNVTASVLDASTSVKRIIPDQDPVLEEYELVVDEEVPFSIDFAHDAIWVGSSEFIQRFLERGGESSISISEWKKTPTEYTAIGKQDNFHGTRRVSYVHNKKYMVGPSTIPTVQSQRFRWDAGSRLVIAITTVVSDAPYCDYFRAENRWVFSNTAKEGVSRLQVGISIQWVKSTWLKKQIESTAMGEAKEYTRTLINAAIEEAKKHAHEKPSLVAQSLSITECDQPSPEVASLPKQVEIGNGVPVSPVPKTNSVASHAETFTPVSANVTGAPAKIKTLLQLANLICVFLFFYMMYRIGSTLDQMQLLARETLEHQKLQQELFREILSRLHGQGGQ